jgi:hypothetical protein
VAAYEATEPFGAFRSESSTAAIRPLHGKDSSAVFASRVDFCFDGAQKVIVPVEELQLVTSVIAAFLITSRHKYECNADYPE